MPSGGHNQKLTDDEVRQIMLAPAEISNRDLAATFGVAHQIINGYRKRKYPRALRIAADLGLLPEMRRVLVWRPGDRRATQRFADA